MRAWPSYLACHLRWFYLEELEVLVLLDLLGHARPQRLRLVEALPRPLLDRRRLGAGGVCVAVRDAVVVLRCATRDKGDQLLGTRSASQPRRHSEINPASWLSLFHAATQRQHCRCPTHLVHLIHGHFLLDVLLHLKQDGVVDVLRVRLDQLADLPEAHRRARQSDALAWSGETGNSRPHAISTLAISPQGFAQPILSPQTPPKTIQPTPHLSSRYSSASSLMCSLSSVPRPSCVSGSSSRMIANDPCPSDVQMCCASSLCLDTTSTESATRKTE